ncbi:MAG: DUF1080 domain-containing protein [Candidatus Sumerlaeia bacterium]|nr:DUF1080 domain-containing protein [Candidatus Sumerlaeia bacterium]
MFRKQGFRLGLCLIVLAALSARAEVRLPHLLSDGMVLQQGAPIRIWGWADEGEQVAVQFLNQTDTTIASRGKWMITLQPVKAGGPYELTVYGKNTPKPIVIKDVYVGEVWVCSGQSNMQWALSQVENAEQHIAAAKNPNLHLFYVPRVKSDVPLDDTSATWKVCTPESARDFSAVAYFFGRDLQKALGVPVGLIHTCWGGSPAEVWCKESVLASNPLLKPILDNYAAAQANYEKAKAAYDAAKSKAKKDGKPAAQPPRAPWKPCELYNGMIAPLLPYSIKGAIWYQGESNAGRAQEYRVLFPAMIQNWRRDWNCGEFPFLAVQLAPFMAVKDQPSESNWAELREAQFLATKVLPNVGLAVITDVGDPNDIHPKKKEPVGARLALAARGIAYGEKIEYSGPVFKSLRASGNRLVLSFDHVGKGLESRGGPLKGFAIAGEDGKWVWADAEIKGKTVVVSAAGVAKPVAVRYGWADCPVVNLWNKDGLPACPFQARLTAGEDTVMGMYQGTFTPHKGGASLATAKVVAEGNRNYRVVLEVMPDGDAKPLSVELRGRIPSRLLALIRGSTLRLASKDRKWTGALCGNVLKVRGEGGEAGWFSLYRLEPKSPTEGAKPPQGAVVLLPYEPGKPTNLDEWTNKSWKILPDGSVEVFKGENRTLRLFGDCQLHVEFMTPYEPLGRGQGRGNSGVYLQNLYEVQVLDSFGLPSKDNECGGLYSISAPKMIASFPPLRWQTYDITFRAPRFNADGSVGQYPRITVVHNGIEIQKDVELKRDTENRKKAPVAKGPIKLQDHGHPVRYRNMWLVELKEAPAQPR